MDLYVETAGSGEPAVVLVHSGISDCRMWDRAFAALAAGQRVVRYDVRGFGRSPDGDADYFDHADLLDLLDHLGIEPAVLVGTSNGGRIVLDTAVAAPDRVVGMVLVASALPGVPLSDNLEALFDEEDQALLDGDYERAKQINLQLWIDGVGRRSDQVPASVREQVAGWLDELLPRQAAQAREGRAESQLMEPLVRDRLGEISAPALVMVGAHDQPRQRAIAQHLAFHLPDAQLVVVDDAAHLISLEQPELFERLLYDFLARLP